jgi:predicted dienelactone hydrolase
MKENVVVLRGSFVGHRDLAEALADAGFIVAAINHPSDSSHSPEHDHKDPLSALTDRPVDIKRLIDFMLGACPSGRRSIATASVSSAFRAAASPDSP